MGFSTIISHAIFLLATIIISSVIILGIWNNYYIIRNSLAYEAKVREKIIYTDFKIENVVKSGNYLMIYVRNTGKYAITNVDKFSIYFEGSSSFFKTPSKVELKKDYNLNDIWDSDDIVLIYVDISDIPSDTYILKICLPIEKEIKCDSKVITI